MKKYSYIAAIIVSFIIFALLSVTVFAAAGQETSLDTGDRNVAFSNGFRGFCLDVNLKGAHQGDTFTSAEDTSAATSNKNGSDVSAQLKVLFTQCFEDLFEPDGNGGYQIKDTNIVQAVVWHFTEDQYVYGEQRRLVNLVNAYTGAEIQDSGYVRQISNGDYITFHFKVMVPNDPALQCFFAYKIEVSNQPPHQHEWPEKWSKDSTHHWLECDCGEENSRASHTYEDGVCEVCEATDPTYNPNVDPDNTPDDNPDNTPDNTPENTPDNTPDSTPDSTQNGAEDNSDGTETDSPKTEGRVNVSWWHLLFLISAGGFALIIFAKKNLCS